MNFSEFSDTISKYDFKKFGVIFSKANTELYSNFMITTPTSRHTAVFTSPSYSLTVFYTSQNAQFSISRSEKEYFFLYDFIRNRAKHIPLEKLEKTDLESESEYLVRFLDLAYLALNEHLQKVRAGFWEHIVSSYEEFR